MNMLLNYKLITTAQHLVYIAAYLYHVYTACVKMQGLNVHSEEKHKSVPILKSSVYGHRPPLETPGREHVRVGLVQRDIYRQCGTNMNPNA